MSDIDISDADRAVRVWRKTLDRLGPGTEREERAFREGYAAGQESKHNRSLDEALNSGDGAYRP